MCAELWACSRERWHGFRKTWRGLLLINVGQSPDGGCRRYDAACAAARDASGTVVGGIQDRQRQKRVDGCGVGMRRREWIAC